MTRWASKASFTPWSRAALDALGISRFVLEGRIPPGWYLSGFANSPRGPWHFDVRSEADPEPRTFTAHSLSDVFVAVERALASMGSDDLESTLAASLAARGIAG